MNDVWYFWNAPSGHPGLFREVARPSNEVSGGFSFRCVSFDNTVIASAP